MTGSTHLAGGALAGSVAGHVLGDPVMGAVVGAIAGLLPDVDHPGSIAGRRLRPLAVVLESAFGHRSITHTLYFAVVMALLLGIISGLLGFLLPIVPAVWSTVAYALAGGLSHLILDGLTRSGISPLQPWSEWHISGPCVTGHVWSEVGVSALCWMLAIFTIL